MAQLHDNEIHVDEEVVRSLLRSQCPDWADLPLASAGEGTDNTMYRLGHDLLVRLPRTPDTARSVRKEQQWLPRLAPHLDCMIPEPVHAGSPTSAYPLTWSIYRWIDGAEPGSVTVTDWSTFGADLARSVRQLHQIDLMGVSGTGDLAWYRGASLHECADWFSTSFEQCHRLVDADVDLSTVERMWRDALALPDPTTPHVWLHGDLKPTNLLVQGGRFHAMIDFGCLSIGYPDAEHSTVWDLPAAAREAYWCELDIDEPTWLRARAWAVLVAVSGISYYWETLPAYVAECLARLGEIVSDARNR